MAAPRCSRPIRNGATTSCFMSTSTATTAPDSAPVTRRGGRASLHASSSSTAQSTRRSCCRQACAYRCQQRPERRSGPFRTGFPVAGENALGNHAVHPLAYVDDLRHATIADHGGERIRLLPAHRYDLLAAQPADGLLHCDFHRLIQILVVAHEDPVGFRFGPRPLGLQILTHDGLDLDFLVGALERRQVDLAVALAAVRVT